MLLSTFFIELLLSNFLFKNFVFEAFFEIPWIIVCDRETRLFRRNDLKFVAKDLAAQ